METSKSALIYASVNTVPLYINIKFELNNGSPYNVDFSSDQRRYAVCQLYI